MSITATVEDGDRQLLLLALAHLSLARPGFDDALNRLALKFDCALDGRAAMYDDFRLLARQTPCLSALASGAACQPDESLKRCAICGFVVDTKFAAAQPTVRMRP